MSMFKMVGNRTYNNPIDIKNVMPRKDDEEYPYLVVSLDRKAIFISCSLDVKRQALWQLGKCQLLHHLLFVRRNGLQ